MLETQYTYNIVAIDLAKNYARKQGGVVSTGCEYGAYGFSRIYREKGKSHLSQQKLWKLQRSFLFENVWCEKIMPSVTEKILCIQGHGR